MRYGPNDPIPAMLGAWDSALSRISTKEAADEADAIAAETQAKRLALTSELDTLIDNGDATALVAGAKWPMRGGVVQAVTLSDVLYESCDTFDMNFRPVAAYLLERAGEGDEAAQALLSKMAKAWVESQL
jgi:hypothetical protein